MSKYISLLACRICCLRHGIGAENGAVLEDWMLLLRSAAISSDAASRVPRYTSYIEELAHERRRKDNLLEHCGLHCHRVPLVQHLFNQLGWSDHTQTIHEFQTSHIHHVKVLLQRRLGHVAEIVLQCVEKRL